MKAQVLTIHDVDTGRVRTSTIGAVTPVDHG